MNATIERSGSGPKVSVGTLVPSVGNDFTRKELLIGAGLLVLAPACGRGGEGSAKSGSSGGTRTIEHKFGSTEISGTPRRIVTVGDNDQDPVLALGATPVALRDWFGDQPHAVWPWAQDELGDATPEVLAAAPQGLEFERIASLRADVVIGTFSAMTKKEYETLSQIAPTVAQSADYPDFGQPWQEVTVTVGRVLGRVEEARRLVADIEERFDSARRAHPEFEGKSVVVGSAWDGNYVAYTETDTAIRFLAALGFDISPEIEELAIAAGAAGTVEISEERLDLFDADLLVWYEDADAGHGLLENPLYTRLDVHQQGREIFLGYVPLGGALAFSTVLSLPFALDVLVPMLAAAIDGDPDTQTTR